MKAPKRTNYFEVSYTRSERLRLAAHDAREGAKKRWKTTTGKAIARFRWRMHHWKIKARALWARIRKGVE